MYINYKEIEQNIKDNVEGKGNSVIMVIENNHYNIYSYATLISSLNIINTEVTYFNYKYFSNTTTRLQNIIKDVYSLACKDRIEYNYLKVV